MFRLTTGVALRALFSARISPADAEELRTVFDAFLKGTYLRAVLPAAAKLPVPANLRYARALDSWRGQVQRLISESRRLGADGDDLMSRLVRSSDIEEDGMSDFPRRTASTRTGGSPQMTGGHRDAGGWPPTMGLTRAPAMLPGPVPVARPCAPSGADRSNCIVGVRALSFRQGAP